MSCSGHTAALISSAVLAGLLLEMLGGLPGQCIAAFVACVVLFFILKHQTGPWRVTLLSGIVLATAAEAFFALYLRWYDYRLQNVPAFVPPGHVLLFILSAWVASKLSDWAPAVVLTGAGAYAVMATIGGWGQLELCLFAVCLIAFGLGTGHKPYAATLLLALALELLGTATGAWVWPPSVASLSTTSPPVLAGAAYICFDGYLRATYRAVHRVMVGDSHNFAAKREETTAQVART